jgi:nucleoside-diphosphate-sugar epimerase
MAELKTQVNKASVQKFLSTINDCVNAIKYVIENDIFDGEIYNILTLNLTVGDVIASIKKEIPDVGVKFVDSAIMNQICLTERQ